jgi:hypothetical protein
VDLIEMAVAINGIETVELLGSADPVAAQAVRFRGHRPVFERSASQPAFVNGVEGVIFGTASSGPGSVIRLDSASTADALAARQRGQRVLIVIDSSGNVVAGVPAAPVNTVLPVVSGTLNVGQTLSSTTGTWTGSPAPTYTYQWQSDTAGNGTYANIGGATSSTYLLTSGEQTDRMRVIVTATNASGAVSATSAATTAIQAELTAPVNTVAPAISGTATEGQTLTATTGTWTGNPTPTYAYQWQSDTAGNGTFVNISGATASTYLLTSNEVGNDVRVRVTATNSQGVVSANSTETAAVGALGSEPDWVLSDAVIDIDFAESTAWNGTASVAPTSLITCTRAQTVSSYGTSFNGTRVAFAANTARISDRGLLVESARQNICLQSENLNSGWTKTNLTTTSLGLLADNRTWWRLTNNAVDDFHSLARTITLTAAQHAFSWLVKANTYQFVYLDVFDTATGSNGAGCGFDLNAGTADTAYTYGSGFTNAQGFIEAVGSGIYKISLVFTAPAGSAELALYPSPEEGGATSYPGGDAASVDVTSPQVELGDHASSYIPTTTTAVTRNADVVKTNNITWLNASAGSLYAEGSPQYSSPGSGSNLPTLVSLDDNTIGDRIQIRREDDADKRCNVIAVDGGATQVEVTGNVATWTTSEWHKVAVGYEANDYRAAFDGSLTAADTAATVPTVTQCQLGAGPGGQALNGHLRRFAYAPTRLDDVTLQIWTYVDDAPPVNTELPEIDGNVASDPSLAATDGVWLGDPSGYTYQWERDGVEIPGAIASSYDITGDDVGTTLSVVVTAINAFGETAAESLATSTIPASTPVNTVVPVITGGSPTPAPGEVLIASTGTWTGVPTPTFTYQWRAGVGGTTVISGATGSTYQLTADESGDIITVAVTATNSAGNATAVSVSVGPVAAAADVTAPLLTDFTMTRLTTTTASLEITTNEGTGTIYFVRVADGAAAPSAAQIKAGLNGSGAAALWSQNVALSTIETWNTGLTGLTAATPYDVYAMHEDAAGNQSLVAMANLNAAPGAGGDVRAFLLGGFYIVEENVARSYNATGTYFVGAA